MPNDSRDDLYNPTDSTSSLAATDDRLRNTDANHVAEEAVDQDHARMTTPETVSDESGSTEEGASTDHNGSSSLEVPPPLSVVSLLPTQLTLSVRETGNLMITIDPVQSTDTEIPITVNPPDLAKVPSIVTIPKGETTQTFPIERLQNGQLSITAHLNDSVEQALVGMPIVPLSSYRSWYRSWVRQSDKGATPLSSNAKVRSIQCASDSLLGSFFILFILFLVAYVILRYTTTETTLPIVLLFGALGSFVSQQRRLREFSDEDFELFNFSPMYKWLSPIGGAILAGILYLMFIGNLLAGGIFPAFKYPEKAEIGIQVIFQIGSSNPVDYAKLMFWSFIAGYSERFVTDLLGRFESQGAQPSDGAGSKKPV
ncbi:MAG: hypothetical protein JSR20_18295 [Nitrospira sp.]|nr:hypothetical protein [Nitrospira sp.]